MMEERTKRSGLEMFEQALKNVSPVMEVKARRVGGATYQVPMEVAPYRRFALATRWLLSSARSRSGKSFSEKLAAELTRTAGTLARPVALLTGSGGMDKQRVALNAGATLAVGTMGRIEELLARGFLRLDKLRTVVLDEVDELLKNGFSANLATLLGTLPRERQTLLFSATIPTEVEAVARTFTKKAARLRLSPLQPAAAIRVTDSLQAGSSRFYAEITRLRQIVDLTSGPVPVLFLLDVFLHGTNSHDRRIGAEAIVRGLVERGAIGLVTTHDLALAHIADVLAPRGANVHFEDRLEDGKLHFDYLLRPGVVRKSNALELMRSVGLEV
jgi:hypothetical protein